MSQSRMREKVAQLQGVVTVKSWGSVQATGGLIALGGFYLATNLAAALMLGGASLVAVATGKEAGWL